MPSRLWTIKKAADELGIHPDTLRRWADDGKIPVIRFPESNYRRFRPEDVEALKAKMEGRDAEGV